MKKLLILVICLILVFGIIGCGGTSQPTGKYIVKVISITGTPAKTIAGGPVNNPDGHDGKFNASTAYNDQYGTSHRQSFLKAVITDENGIEITDQQYDQVTWTSDFDSSDIIVDSGVNFIFNSNDVGVHHVIAHYQDYSSIDNIICLYHRFWTGDQRLFNCKLKISTYDENSSNPDVTLSYAYNTTHVYTINASGGIAIIESQVSTYLDPIMRFNMGNYSTVPGNLTFLPSITLAEDTSAICIIKDSSGGYMKVLFSQGLHTGTYEGLDCYAEYEPADQWPNFAIHH